MSKANIQPVLTNEEYHKTEGVSSTTLQYLEESPIHFENRDLFKLESSSFTLGTLVHKMVLEPDTLLEEFIKEDFEGCELNKNSKAYKEAKEAFIEASKGKEVIPVDLWKQAERMTKNVMAIAGNLLTNGVPEMSVFHEDEEYSIKRKCRPDYYREDLELVIDLKTTKSSKDRDFSKSIYDFSYHRQGSWYLDTMELAGYKAKRFLFIMVDVSAPHMVRVRELSQEAINVGRANYVGLLDGYKEYKESGVANLVKNISLPEWA